MGEREDGLKIFTGHTAVQLVTPVPFTPDPRAPHIWTDLGLEPGLSKIASLECWRGSSKLSHGRCDEVTTLGLGSGLVLNLWGADGPASPFRRRWGALTTCTGQDLTVQIAGATMLVIAGCGDGSERKCDGGSPSGGMAGVRHREDTRLRPGTIVILR